MKNNEYNLVNVTNEKNNFSAEYTTAQKAEFSFQAENVNPIKDELNDNTVNNDKVEENTSKKTKEKEKKQEQESTENIEQQLSSTASSTAAASSSSTVAHSIVAAATVSVAAIGAAVGIVVVGEQEQIKEQIVFTESEITTNQVHCKFNISSKLLRYEEDPDDPDAPIIERSLSYTIKDGTGIPKEDYIGYEPIDEDVFECYLDIYDLTPDTAYALDIFLDEYNSQSPDPEEPNKTTLASRTFRTKAIAKAVTINIDHVDHDYVEFTFYVNKTAVGYNPELEMPVIQCTIESEDGQDYDEGFPEQLDDSDPNNLVGIYAFSGLRAEHKYTITIKLDVEGALQTLGSTTFRTPAIEAGFEFLTDSFVITSSSIKIYFDVNEDVAHYSGQSSDIRVELYLGGADIIKSDYVTDFETSTESGKLTGTYTFTQGLTASTEYKVRVVIDSTLTELGSTTVSTSAKPSSRFTMLPAQTGTSYKQINFSFVVNAEYVGYIEGETTPNIFATISLNDQLVDSKNITEFSTYSGGCRGDGYFDGLVGSTTYMIAVYYSPNGETEKLGEKEFTTKEGSDFEFADVGTYFYVGQDYISPMFYIAKSEVIPGGTVEVEDPQTGVVSEKTETNIYATIEDFSSGYSDTIHYYLEDFSSSDDLRYFARGTFYNLEAGTTYTISVSKTGAGGVYGSVSVPTKSVGGFSFSTFDNTANRVSFTFLINSSEIQESQGASGTNIYAAIEDFDGYSETVNVDSFEEVSGTSQSLGTVTFSGLAPNTEYTVRVYNTNQTKYGSTTTQTDVSPSNFSFGSITPTVDGVSAMVYLDASYVRYGDDPDVGSKLSYSMTEYGGASPITGYFDYLNLYQQDETVLEASLSYTGLTAGSTYTIQILYTNSQQEVEILGRTTFTTSSAQAQFNTPSFATECSFSDHLIYITLNYEDPEGNTYNDLTIEFYDQHDDLLGSAFSLEETLSQQTLTIPSEQLPTSGDVQYEFGLGDVCRYIILNGGDELVADSLTFEDTDASDFNSVNTNWYMARDVNTDEFVMPIQLQFTDTAHAWDEGFVLTMAFNGGDTYTTDLMATTEFQYAVFDSSYVSMITNDLGSHLTCTVTIVPITDNPDEEAVFDEGSIEPSNADVNWFYDGEITSDYDIDENDTTISFSSHYIHGDDNSIAEIVLIDMDDPDIEYSYGFITDLAQLSYSDSISVNLMYFTGSSGTSLRPYESLKTTLTGNYKIIIRWYTSESAGVPEQVEIASGVSFTYA